MHLAAVLLFIGLLQASHHGLIDASTETKPNHSVDIAKCCEANEIRMDDTCTPLAETNETEPWQPEFVEEKTGGIVKELSTKLNYNLKIGLPRCLSTEHQWHVYYYPSGPDRLGILPSGMLRHYIPDFTKKTNKDWSVYDGTTGSENEDDFEYETIFHDYPFGHYCIDKAILSRDQLIATYAMVCVPEISVRWADNEDIRYIMKQVIDPTFRAISIASYLMVAIVYFVLPQLRDLAGNIITSMALCLVANQCACMVSIFTEFGNHVSFLIADTVAYVSLLSAFFWLNVLGYYVWNIFKSRCIFIRITDGRTYCFYSMYVWGCTACIAATAIFAHFALETNKPTIGGNVFPPQETVGWLGISVLFTCVAFTIAVNFCFVLTTSNRIKRISTYGRIHHRMTESFRMFIFLFAIMSAGWLSLLMSRLPYETLAYFHININCLQAILILHVCVFSQRRVTVLLGKTYNCGNSGRNTEGFDWGEEMTAINAGY